MEYVQFLPSRRLYLSERPKTSTSMVTIFPPKVIGKVVEILSGDKDHPSKYVRMVGNGVTGGEPRDFQQNMDITDVVVPSSTIVRWMSFCMTMT